MNHPAESMKGRVFEIALRSLCYTTTIGFVLSMGSIFYYGCQTRNYDSSPVQNKARDAAMVHYEPVGNGGALAEMNGYKSKERQEMYEKISRIERVVLEDLSKDHSE